MSATTFDDLFPDAPTGDLHEYAESPYRRMVHPEPCFACNQATLWESASLNLRVCSPDCADTLWDEYFYAVEAVGGVCVGFAEE